MTEKYLLNESVIHLWQIDLTQFAQEEPNLSGLLSTDELSRANRFIFPIHKQRFILCHGIVRRILSLYTELPPQDITFIYGKRGKPFLQYNPLSIQFNVSHSEDLAVIALTINGEIGVDIEKIEPEFKQAVAQRFFSANEYTALEELSPQEQVAAFYRIWAKKEALIKALGEGLYVPLESFSVSVNPENEIVTVTHEQKMIQFYIHYFSIHSNYAAALVSSQVIEKIEYFQWL